MICSLYVSSIQAAQDWIAYITGFNNSNNQGRLAVIDVTNNVLLAPITVPAAGDLLAGIAITPNRQKGFFGSFDTANNLFAIDFSNNSITNIPNLNPIIFFGIAISPDGTKAYAVGADRSSIVNDAILVIDVATNTVITTITFPVNSRPFTMAITPDGTKGYVSVRNLDSVFVLDLLTNTIVGPPIPVGTLPQGIAILPDGTKLYVVNRRSNNVSVISTATNTVITTVQFPVNPNPTLFDLAITPDGSKVYITSSEPPPGIVNIIDTATDTIDPASPITIGSFPQGIFITPDGATAYAVNGNPDNTVSVIDLGTNTVTQTIPLGINFLIAITPDQAPIASFTANVQRAGSPTIFDASSSTPSPQSPANITIAKYDWDFGDGTTATTTNPVIAHTYVTGGTFTVTLTVTNSAGTSTTQTFTGRTVSNNGGPSARTSRTITVGANILPPNNVRGFQVENKWLNRTVLVNVIKWQAPISEEPPVAYRIFRDSLTNLIATVPARKKLIFQDSNIKKGVTYTYFIESVSASGDVSTAVQVIIFPKRD